MNVADLKLGEPDTLGDKVVRFFARKPSEYAVYQTRNRVLVHYADDLIKADEQRKALAQLAPVRGEISGLVDGWREAPDQIKILRLVAVRNGAKLRKRAERFDRRVGDALIVALEGDLTGAGAVLHGVREDVLDERVGWSRFEYLLMALAVASIFVLAAGTVSFATEATVCVTGPLCFDQASDLWRGAMAGVAGSFFSIALALRGRTVLTDLNRTANLTDAFLRIVIGAIAGTVLVSLVLSGFVRLRFGDGDPRIADALYVTIVGFVAGFAERLVPDLLAKAEARTGEAPVLRKPEPDLDKKSAKDGTAAAPNDGAATAVADPTGDPTPGDALEDACVSELPLSDEDVTPDERLPVASGGVASAGRGKAG